MYFMKLAILIFGCPGDMHITNFTRMPLQHPHYCKSVGGGLEHKQLLSADPTSLSLKSFKSSQYFYLDFLLQQTDNYPCKQEQLIWELSPLGKANFTAEYSHFPTEDIQLKTNIFCILFGENLTSLLVLLWQLQLQEEPVAVPTNLSHYPINIHHLRK